MGEIHFIQARILKELMFNPSLSFSKLNTSDVPTDLFNYHIKELIKIGHISKNGKIYILTSKGKEFANQMDTDELFTAKQPKIGAFVIGERKKGKVTELLVQTRLKEPYYGFKGFVTGKVRFGETITETAKREFFEETGLSAKIEFKFVIHEHVFLKNGDLVEDKIFFVCRGYDIRGEIKNTKEGSNEWMSEKDFLKNKYLYYDEKDILKSFRNSKGNFIEKSYFIDNF